jgi:hypothetical protein
MTNNSVPDVEVRVRKRIDAAELDVNGQLSEIRARAPCSLTRVLFERALGWPAGTTMCARGAVGTRLEGC